MRAYSNSLRGNTLNTLAESGTRYNSKSKPFVLIEGDGVSLDEVDNLNKKAKRKLITQTTILGLVDIAKEEGNEEAVKSYWNTFHCQNRLYTHKGKVYGKYCKNRFCTLCTAIRKAEKINEYYPALSKWENPYFLTLTVQAVKAQDLVERIKTMQSVFRKMIAMFKKRNQRDSKCVKMEGIISLECNFNVVKKTYNPHFHLIVRDKSVAMLLKQEWIRYCRKEEIKTNSLAQKEIKITDLTKNLIEVIKYGGKIFTEVDINQKIEQSKKVNYKTKPKLDRMIYLKALHVIFQAMKGKRIFERFGFNKPHQNKNTSPLSKAKLVQEVEEWHYNLSEQNWINKKTGEILLGYKSSPELNTLLSKHIDKECY